MHVNLHDIADDDIVKLLFAENPGVVIQVSDEHKQELRAFHDTIFLQYREIFDEDKNAIFHMKELWSYLVHSFEGSEPYAKKLRKTSSLNEYRCEVGNLFRACDLYPDGPVQWRP